MMYEVVFKSPLSGTTQSSHGQSAERALEIMCSAVSGQLWRPLGETVIGEICDDRNIKYCQTN